MKKGQTEMIGLVIIVVLIVFIGLFALVFMGKGSDDDVVVRRSVVADNMINAISKIDLNEKSMEENAYDCCNGDCDFITEIQDIIDESIEEDYKFMIFEGSNECKSVGLCEEGISSSEYYLRYNRNRYKISLILCESANVEDMA